MSTPRPRRPDARVSRKPARARRAVGLECRWSRLECPRWPRCERLSPSGRRPVRALRIEAKILRVTQQGLVI